MAGFLTLFCSILVISANSKILTAEHTNSVLSGSVQTNLKTVKIAVLVSSKFTQFVKVVHDIDQNVTYIGGFSVHVFESAAKYLQYPLIYNLVPFYGSRDDLIKEISLNKFDAGIGEILITANKNRHVEFSQPYIESNLVMVVSKTKSNEWKQSWMFLKPFTKGMWLAMAAMTVYTGFVVWFLEHRLNSDFRGPPLQQISTSLWFAFSTLVFAQRESIRSIPSRVALLPWFFFIFVITSTYTASLTSMLTNPPLEPTKIDINSLKRTNATVGCDGNSFTIWYLREVLEFNMNNIKSISSIDDLANSLSKRHIIATFLFSPHANIFVSDYCEFAISGPTFRLNGFGYVFPKGSPLALDVSEAIIHLTQSGELQQLEDEKLWNSKCINSGSESGNEGIGVAPFASIFIISGGVSFIALLVGAFRQFRSYLERFKFIETTWMNRDFWLWIPAFVVPNKAKGEIELSIGSCNTPSNINNQ